MHGINQEAPAFDGIISGSDYKPRRVFVDEELELWFEVRPNLFVNTPQGTREAAEIAPDQVANFVADLNTLKSDYPDGKVLYDS